MQHHKTVYSLFFMGVGSAALALGLLFGPRLLPDTPVVAAQATTQQGGQRVFLPFVYRGMAQPEPASIAVEVLSPRIPANGSSTSVISATVADEEGASVPDVTVQFRTTRGLFPNEDVGIDITTDSDGQAVTRLTSAFGIESASVTVTAQVQDRDGQTFSDETTMQFVPPTSLILNVLPSELPADVSKTANVIAIVQDEAGVPVPNYPVNVSTSLGRFPNQRQFVRLTSDAEGIAATTLRGVPQLGAATVSAQITPSVAQAATVELVLGQCNDFEDNDVPAEGNEQPSAICTATLEDDPEGEDDFYVVTLNPQQEIYLALTNQPAGADYDLILYDAALEIQAFSNELTNVDEFVRFTYQGSGDFGETHYIRINMATKTSQARNDYRLQVQLTPLEDVGQMPVVSEHGLASEVLERDPPLPEKP